MINATGTQIGVRLAISIIISRVHNWTLSTDPNLPAHMPLISYRADRPVTQALRNAGSAIRREARALGM